MGRAVGGAPRPAGVPILPPVPDALLLAIVALPLIAALVAAVAPRGRFAIAIGASIAGFVLAIGVAIRVVTTGAFESVMPWVPSLDVVLALRADGLAALFACLVTGIGVLVFVFAAGYLAPSPARDRAAPVLLLFQASMLGAVLADDFVLLFTFWELTSITSFLLVGYDHESAAARRAALQGLLVTVAGGLALLAGIVLLVGATGSLRISTTIGAAALRDGGVPTTVAMLLVIGAAFTKSAQTPFHFWLPNAMAAPTPVSAYLHSATMVKLGVYLLARLDPAFGADATWTIALVGIGTTTMATAAVLALRERDLKRVLAYSTIVALGTLVMLVGLEGPAAASCFALVLLVHALYKSALFFVAGILDHETGTRDATRLGGLGRSMPGTALAAGLAAGSMAGLPPFLGFVGKELLYDVQLSADFGGLLVASSILVNGAMIAVAALVALKPFVGFPDGDVEESHDPSRTMLLPPLVAGALGCAVGLAPQLIEPLIEAVAGSIAPGASSTGLSLWHGWTPELALSLATLIAGVAAYRAWPRTQPILSDIDTLDRLGPERGYERLLSALVDVAKAQTAVLQGGSLRTYVGLTVALIATAALVTLVLGGGLAVPEAGFEAVPIAIAALLAASALVAALASNHALVAFMSAGAAGFGAAVLFLVAGAPDLAFTQLAVEALAIVIFLAVLGRLPLRRPDPRLGRERRRDAGIAILFGTSVALLLLAAVAGPMDTAVADWFRDNSLPAAHGRNVVNVIIVDFRALDTLGEIAVLAFAALGAIALVRGSRRLAP